MDKIIKQEWEVYNSETLPSEDFKMGFRIAARYLIPFLEESKQYVWLQVQMDHFLDGFNKKEREGDRFLKNLKQVLEDFSDIENSEEI